MFWKADDTDSTTFFHFEKREMILELDKYWRFLYGVFSFLSLSESQLLIVAQIEVKSPELKKLIFLARKQRPAEARFMA